MPNHNETSKTLNEHQINILYAPFAKVDTSVLYELSQTTFNAACSALMKSNKLNNNVYSTSDAICYVIVSHEEQGNASKIIEEYSSGGQPFLDIRIKLGSLKSTDDWFIVIFSVNSELEHNQEFPLSESSSFIYGKYLAVNKDCINT